MQNSPKAPIVVTIFFGANDAAVLGRTSEKQHVPLEEYKYNLKKMVNHLKVLTPSFMLEIFSTQIFKTHFEDSNQYNASVHHFSVN